MNHPQPAAPAAGTEHSQEIGVAMIGYSFMGAAHSHAWRSAPRFFELSRYPRMRLLCGRDPGGVKSAAARLGWEDTETSWETAVARDDVQLVDICTPGDTHAEIAIAALRAGKHVLCEKPLATSVAEAEAMAEAATAARDNGVRTMVGFTYRRVPAIALARRLVEQGRIGTVRHVRAQYLQDWLVDADEPMSWRLRKERAGAGALGDIGTHVIDLAQYITGEHITAVNGMTETFVPSRPSRPGAAPQEHEPVTVDDAAVFLARFTSGALGSFEATRYAAGRKNAIRIEINGSAGSLAFDFEDMNVLHFYDATDGTDTAGFRRIVVTEPDHPYLAAWWPPGHGLGYEHGFTHQVVDLINAVSAGEDPAPDFADGLQVQRVMTAVEGSAAAHGAWQEVFPTADAPVS